MATTTQHDPRQALDARLRQAGASKTVYALVTPEIEAVKAELLGNSGGNGRASPRHGRPFRKPVHMADFSRSIMVRACCFLSRL